MASSSVDALAIDQYLERERAAPDPRRMAEADRVLTQMLVEAPRSARSWVLRQINAAEDPDGMLVELIDRWEYFPPSIVEFIESPRFLGLRGEVWPAIMDILVEIVDGGFVEIVLTGSIGWGKSLASDILEAYTLCELTGLRSIWRTFGLVTGTEAVMVLQSLTAQLAKRVLFRPLRYLVRRSPYFQGITWDKRVESELHFKRGIRVLPVAGNEQAAIGENVVSCTMDEVNFMSVIVDSTRARGADEYDVAKQNYNAISKRMRSRFMRRGKLPCRLIVVSSSRYPEDFTEAKAAESKSDPSIYVARRSQWETKPLLDADGRPRFLPGRFKLLVGGQFTRTRILGAEEPEPAGARVIEVPEDYRKDFERDPDGALRDVAGIPTQTIHPFFPRRETLRACVDETLQHPFSLTSTTLRDGCQLLLDRLHLDVPAPRAIHLDLSVSGDKTGLAMGYVCGLKTVERTAMEVAAAEESGRKVRVEELSDGRRRYVEDLPCIVIEAMLQIVAPPGDEIMLPAVVDLVLKLQRAGVPIKFASADTFQSTSPLQMLWKAGIATGQLSCDRTPQPYLDFKQAAYDGRLRYYFYAPFLSEALNLEKHEKTGRIDHPVWGRDLDGNRVKGSKDVTDGVAGVCHVLSRRSEVWWQPPLTVELSTGGTITVGDDGIAVGEVPRL